jgi:hypothetical protein
MISHASHGFSFSGKNQRSFNTSNISKPWLRHSQERKSKSFELIKGESDAGASPAKHKWRTARHTSAHFEEV